LKSHQKVSEAPTIPKKGLRAKQFDVADFFGLARTAENAPVSGLDEKLRQAYFWITNNAIISPFYDIEYNTTPPLTYILGDSKSKLTLPSGQSYSSFVLLPLINLVVRRRCLLVGGPGRGKTASAILMGLLAGYTMKELKRAIQHGQPQMTVSDLLGNPVPSDLMTAKNMDEIKIAWRKWLSMRVKIIDEYNRIPTRTQSALLTVLADNYAEILDQIYECPEAAWYLTANDDSGGGTYQVIEALRDRIDVVVKALHFNTRFFGELLSRIESGIKPENVLPPEIIFNESEIDRVNSEIMGVTLPVPLLRRIEFFASQFEYLESAAEQIEYKTKDTLKLAGADFQQVVSQETGKDKSRDTGDQTKNGLSVRAMMTVLVFVKAIAYFRSHDEVEFEDVRNILPFVLHDKLIQNTDSGFFDQPGNAVYRMDRISWIRKLFDLSCAEYDRLNLDKADPLKELDEIFSRGLEGVSQKDAKSQMQKIQTLLEEFVRGRKFYGHNLDEVLKLKYLHQRYTNYLAWLETQK